MSDKDLAIAAQSGNMKAMGVLLSRHEDHLFNSLRKIMTKGEKHPDDSDVKDVCQETFRKVITKIHTYNPDMKFFSWITTIGKNTFYDMQNHLNLISVMQYEDKDADLHTAATEDSPEERIIDEQTRIRLNETIETLPELYRDPIKLQIYSELSYEEISSQLGIPLNTVRTRIRRAKAMIEDIMQSI